MTGKYHYATKVVCGGPRAASQQLAELIASSKESTSGVTVEHLMPKFLELCERSGLAKTPVFSYGVLAKKYIVPMLGKLKVDNLSARDLDNLYRSMLGKGLSASRVRYAQR